MKKQFNEWNPDILGTLIEKSSVTIESLSNSTGVPVPSIRNYLNHGTTPSVDVLIAFADFFDVPLDYICGRYNLEESKKLIDNYDENFMKLRRCAYDEYLVNIKHDILPDHLSSDSTFDSPWPYSLIDAIFGFKYHEPLEVINRRMMINEYGSDFDIPYYDSLTDAQMQRIDVVLDNLPEREGSILRRYYRDNNRFESIADSEGVSVSRVKQLAARGLHKLRHRSNLDYIFKGPEWIEKESAFAKEKADMEYNIQQCRDSYEAVLDNINKKKDKLKTLFDKFGVDLSEYENIETEIEAAASEKTYLPFTTKIENLNLSTRSYNCLKRLGVDTLEDIVKIVKADKLFSIPGVGKRSYSEIVSRIDPRFLIREVQ